MVGAGEVLDGVISSPCWEPGDSGLDWVGGVGTGVQGINGWVGGEGCSSPNPCWGPGESVTG